TDVTGTNITVNGLLSKDIQTAVTTFSAGVQLQLLTAREMSDGQAMAQIMPVRFDRHVLFNPYINYGYYLAPSFMPMMLLILAVMATIFAVGTELKYGTAAEWLHTGGGSMTAALTGKLLPVTALLLLQAFVMLFILLEIVGVPMNGSFAVMAVGTVCFLLAYQSIAVMIVALMANMRLSLSLGGGYSVFAFTFSGLTFPIMAMWAPMRWLSRCFPFTYYTDLFIDQMMRGAPVVYSLPDLGYMALFAVLPMLVLPRLRKVCTEPKFWGRE
ncbi:MAG: ABC transporter permease, partial [Alistipes sp.]|nr:ABC transporter permease [Alistipes sp.]